MAMTRQKALALAKKKWGKNVYLSYNENAPDPETRRILRAELDKIKAEEPKAPPPTPEQEAYRKAWKAWKESKERLFGHLHTDRWRLVVSEHGIGWVKGCGDTVEEACQKAGLLS